MKKANKFLFLILGVFCLITPIYGDPEENGNNQDAQTSSEESSNSNNSGPATTWAEAFDQAVKHPSDAAPWEE